jgi:hypothetical protein
MFHLKMNDFTLKHILIAIWRKNVPDTALTQQNPFSPTSPSTYLVHRNPLSPAKHMIARLNKIASTAVGLHATSNTCTDQRKRLPHP